MKVWLDVWEMLPGQSWQTILSDMIENAKAAAVLIGENGVGPWQEEEIQSLLQEYKLRGMPVIPVLLPGAPDRPKIQFLRNMTWVDLRRGFRKVALEALQRGIRQR